MADYPPFNQPFEQQVAFFRQKLNLPTERWDDIKLAANDRAFYVAGAQGADLLDDLKAAVDKAALQGTGLDAFRKDFASVVAKNGWTGWTGEGTKAGVAWRTRVIYWGNMATSYAAGRWQQLNDPALLKVAPYFQYHHMDGQLHPRPFHESWDGITLPYDHDFWKTHACPNGWFCHCWISAVSKSVYMTAITRGKGKPPDGWDVVDPKTGEQVGIDKGWGYAPGANVDTSLRQIVQDKLITYPDAITKALSRDVNRYVNAKQDASTFAREVLTDTTRVDPLWIGFVENFEAIKAATDSKVDAKGYMVLIPAEAPRHVDTSHGFDGGSQRPATPDDYTNVQTVLADYDSISLSDKLSVHGLQMIVALKKIGDEIFRCVFEVRPGKKNRALALWSLVIKQ